MAKKISVSAIPPPLQSPFAGLICEGLPENPAEPPAPAAMAKTKTPRIVLRLEKAGRGGKTVVVVSQLPSHLSRPEIENLLRAARKSLGCGGAVNEREIELQGDQPERVRAFFENAGFHVGGV
ncbi:MAG: translation initiation factor [Verrucomicrobiota bacterium]